MEVNFQVVYASFSVQSLLFTMFQLLLMSPFCVAIHRLVWSPRCDPACTLSLTVLSNCVNNYSMVLPSS